MKQVIDDTRAVLAEHVTAAQLGAQHTTLKTSLTKTRNRLHSITRNPNKWESTGELRQQAQLEGDHGKLEAFDREAEILTAQAEAADGLLKRLRDRLERTQATEFVDGLPGKYAAVEANVEQREQLRKQLAKLEREADVMLRDIEQGRTHAVRCGHRDFPLPPEDLLKRHVAALGIHPLPEGTYGASIRTVMAAARQLGIETPRAVA